MRCVIEKIVFDDNRHEVTVTACGEEYIITEKDFFTLGSAEDGEVEIEKLAFAEQKLKCIKKAENILSYSPSSVSALAKKLEKSFGGEVVEQVILLFIEKGFLNDSELSSRLASDIAAKRRWGKIRIAAYLREKGFIKEDITNAIDEIDESVFEENICFLARKRHDEGKVDLNDKKSISKLFAFLYRLGYSWEDSQKAITSIKEPPDEN